MHIYVCPTIWQRREQNKASVFAFVWPLCFVILLGFAAKDVCLCVLYTCGLYAYACWEPMLILATGWSWGHGAAAALSLLGYWIQQPSPLVEWCCSAVTGRHRQVPMQMWSIWQVLSYTCKVSRHWSLQSLQSLPFSPSTRKTVNHKTAQVKLLLLRFPDLGPAHMAGFFQNTRESWVFGRVVEVFEKSRTDPVPCNCTSPSKIFVIESLPVNLKVLENFWCAFFFKVSTQVTFGNKLTSQNIEKICIYFL